MQPETVFSGIAVAACLAFISRQSYLSDIAVAACLAYINRQSRRTTLPEHAVNPSMGAPVFHP
jgi:hypothetical protein